MSATRECTGSRPWARAPSTRTCRLTTIGTRCTDSRQLPGGFAAAYLARRYVTVLAFPEIQDQSRVLAAVVNVAGPAEIPRCKLVPDCPCVLAAPPAQDTNRYRYPGRRPRRECHSHRFINITVTGTAPVPLLRFRTPPVPARLIPKVPLWTAMLAQ